MHSLPTYAPSATKSFCLIFSAFLSIPNQRQFVRKIGYWKGCGRLSMPCHENIYKSIFH